MGKSEWAKMLAYHRSEIGRLESLKPSCHSCSHYAMRNAHCAKFNAYPPQDVLAEGCDDWDMDDIPF
jgi:hypothetical protein